jgi:hypothetical protein
MSVNAPTQLAHAIEQIQNRPPVPDIDYTQHTLEDGTSISTQERVIKDVSVFLIFRNIHTAPTQSALGPVVLVE